MLSVTLFFVRVTTTRRYPGRGLKDLQCCFAPHLRFSVLPAARSSRDQHGVGYAVVDVVRPFCPRPKFWRARARSVLASNSQMAQHTVGRCSVHKPDICYNECFQIRHYARMVTFTVRDLLPKSRDAVMPHITALLLASSKKVVCQLFSTNDMTVGMKSIHQLDALTETLEHGRILFVRCIKADPEIQQGLPQRPASDLDERVTWSQHWRCDMGDCQTASIPLRGRVLRIAPVTCSWTWSVANQRTVTVTLYSKLACS